VGLPFLHANLAHIMANTVPLIVLLCLLAGSRANSIDIVVYISVIAGVLEPLFISVPVFWSLV